MAIFFFFLNKHKNPIIREKSSFRALNILLLGDERLAGLKDRQELSLTNSRRAPIQTRFLIR